MTCVTITENMPAKEQTRKLNAEPSQTDISCWVVNNNKKEYHSREEKTVYRNTDNAGNLRKSQIIRKQ